MIVLLLAALFCYTPRRFGVHILHTQTHMIYTCVYNVYNMYFCREKSCESLGHLQIWREWSALLTSSHRCDVSGGEPPSQIIRISAASAFPQVVVIAREFPTKMTERFRFGNYSL